MASVSVTKTRKTSVGVARASSMSARHTTPGEDLLRDSPPSSVAFPIERVVECCTVHHALDRSTTNLHDDARFSSESGKT